MCTLRLFIYLDYMLSFVVTKYVQLSFVLNYKKLTQKIYLTCSLFD